MHAEQWEASRIRHETPPVTEEDRRRLAKRLPQVDFYSDAAVYDVSRNLGLWEGAPYRVLEESASSAFCSPDQEDLAWLEASLACVERQEYVASLASDNALPPGLFEPMLRAAVDCQCPSGNRDFVLPCVRDFGAAAVNHWLLNVLETGPDGAKAGAVRGLYWASSQPLSEDVQERKRLLILKEFLANPNLDLRRGLVSQLDLDPAEYPESNRPLIAAAIDLARAQPDSYIRARIEVQLDSLAYRRGQATGKPRPLPCLPESAPGF